MQTTIKVLLVIISCGVFASCGNTQNRTKDSQAQLETVTVPEFNFDSAYRYIEEQLAFGARVPGSEAHKKCLDYLEAHFTRLGAEVEIQEGYGTLYDGTRADLYNVIAKLNPKATRRVIVCAHWDCRPWADNDPNADHHHTPVMGANDGASGVGVIMEMCRVMSSELPEVGVDFILFDLEDSGTPTFYEGEDRDDTWCLGSQYWAKTLKNTSDKPMYGILLDMVGAPGAQFFKEGISTHFAPQIVEKIWNKASEIGYSNYFIPRKGGMVTDDHLYVNTIANIPCANIIQHNPYSDTGFGDYWHTLEDDIRNIDRNTLMVVGKTVLEVLYAE